jgi:hypothetical protein
MKMIRDHQIADLLLVALERLAYSKYISGYPSAKGRRNFDTSSTTDSFYKNVCTVSFHDSLLVTAALLDEKNKKGVSFWNWRDLKTKKQQELKEASNLLASSGLKGVRDQVVGHVDADNHNNNFPSGRRQGIVDERLIQKLDDIHSRLVKIFFDFTSEIGERYSPHYFDTANATSEIKVVMDAAPPVLTDSFVI